MFRQAVLTKTICTSWRCERNMADNGRAASAFEGRRDGDRLNPVVESSEEPVEKPKMNFSMNFKNTQGDKRKSSEHEAEPSAKKISIGFNIMKNKSSADTEGNDVSKKSVAPIKMSLGAQKPKEPPPVLKKASASVAKAFNPDDESDEEEMPAECKMKMRNIGRDTPTAAGPNSFGKGKMGFCDRQKIIQRELQQQMDQANKPDNKK